ncbi:ribonuclease H-like domain-containing protein [Crepidotus variabilis]|uniref:DNA polymerase delta catalytic subunit n=1 Tax=Crepidotus variabilis TaxID=179855 RepID=A0A9P6EQ48_9AGAR|nr:ribonuclease H-like domain-containing protein [Crepidotus variabilis]
MTSTPPLAISSSNAPITQKSTDASKKRIVSEGSFARVLEEMGKLEIEEPETRTCTRSPPPEIEETLSSLTFQKVDIREGYDPRGRSEIRLFGVTKAGNSILARVRNFEHYFYYPAPTAFSEDDLVPLLDLLNEPYPSSAPPIASIELERQATSPNGPLVFKTGKCGYRDLFKAPELSYEAGIPYFLRYMLDTGITALSWLKIPAQKYQVISKNDCISTCQIEVSLESEADLLICDVVDNKEKYAPLRILSFDIECNIATKAGQFSSPKTESVIQIGNMVTTYGQSTPFVRAIFTLDTCSPISGTQVKSFEEEKDMLLAWQKFFMEVDPDIVIGYNITQFDIPFLLERAWVLKLVKFSYMTRLKKCSQRLNFSQGRPKFNTCPGYDGRLVLDVFHHIREHHTGLQGEGAYKLNSVSSHFLNEKKEDIGYDQIPKLQNGDANSRRDLAIYCMKDAYLPLRLLEKLKCFEIEVKEAKEARVPFNVLRLWRSLQNTAKRHLDGLDRCYVVADPA